MTSTFWTNPELIGFPSVCRHRIAQLHLGAAALTPDVETDFAHGFEFYTIPK